MTSGVALSVVERLADWWRLTLQPVERRWAPRSILAGLGLSAVGLWAVPNHWWAEHTFAVNLATALVSALVGGPIALVIIQRSIGRREEHERERREFATQLLEVLRRVLEVPQDVTLVHPVPFGEYNALMAVHGGRQLRDRFSIDLPSVELLYEYTVLNWRDHDGTPEKLAGAWGNLVMMAQIDERTLMKLLRIKSGVVPI